MSAWGRLRDKEQGSTAQANPNQIIMGKRRGRWVRDAARALIASTTASGRFLIMRGGYQRFEQTFIPSFDQLSPFKFTSGEGRWVFEYLARHILRTEAHLQAGFEDLYQIQLRKDIVRPTEKELDDTIYTENAFGRVSGKDGIVH